MRNCITYSNPSILSDFNYEVNEEVTFNFPDTATNCEIITPSGNTEYLDARDIQSYDLKEVGTYEIKVDLATGKQENLTSLVLSQK